MTQPGHSARHNGGQFRRLGGAISPGFLSSDMDRAHRKTPESLDAYDPYLRGYAHYLPFNREGFTDAGRFFAKAIKLDSQYSNAYALLALCHCYELFLSLSEDLGKTIAEVKQHARRAVELDRNNSLAYVVLAWHSIYTKQHDQALVNSNLAVELNPSSALAYNARAFACAFGGRHPEAIAAAECSIRYSPRYPFLIMS